jgi:hypothetical protein
MNIGKRLAVLATYLAVAVGAVCFFIGYGDGSTTPILIFGSWGAVLARIVGKPGMHWLVPLFIFSLYVAFIFFLNTILAKHAERPFPLTTGIIHGLGCFMATLILKPHPHPIPGYETFGIIASILIVAVYLEVDWILAMGPTTPKPTDP